MSGQEAPRGGGSGAVTLLEAAASAACYGCGPADVTISRR